MALLQRIFGRKAAPTWRQGDVFLVSVPEIPAEATPVRPVLAEGEATGHAHALEPGTATVLRAAQGLYVEVPAAGATLRHEEHGPIVLPPGRYAVRIQREYHPQEIRRVID